MSKTLIVLFAPLLLLAACASKPASQAKADEAQGTDPRCLEETGSRIERDGCAGHGRSVSREELKQTGGAQTGDALNRAIIR
jgi:hypothetical protein